MVSEVSEDNFLIEKVLALQQNEEKLQAISRVFVSIKISQEKNLQLKVTVQDPNIILIIYS